MIRSRQAPFLLVLAFLAAALAFVVPATPPAHAGESDPTMQGNYIPLDVPFRVLGPANLTGRDKYNFTAVGTGIPRVGTTGLMLIVSILGANGSPSLTLGVNHPGYSTGERDVVRALMDGGTSTLPVSSTLAVPVDEDVATNQLSLQDIGGYTGSPSSSVTVVVDVVGYFTSRSNIGGGFVAVRQTPLPDPAHSTPIPAGGSRTLSVWPAGGPVPTGSPAVYLNLIASAMTASGGILATPYGYGTSGVIPVIRFWNGASAVSNLAVVKPSADGRVTFTNTSSQPVVLDASISGYTTNSPATGADWLDEGPGGDQHTIAAGQKVDFNLTGTAGLPTTGVAAAVLGIEVKSNTSAGSLRVYPKGTASIASTVVKFQGGIYAVERRANAVVAPGVGGNVVVENTSSGSVTVSVLIRSMFATPTTYATANDDQTLAVTKSSVGPCYAYVENVNHRVMAGCAEDYSLGANYANLAPTGENFAGPAAITRRTDGHVVVVARHVPDGEVWSWDLVPTLGLFNATDKAVRHFRYTKSPVTVATLPVGIPVGFAVDVQGRFWSIDLSDAAPEQPTWKPLDVPSVGSIAAVTATSTPSGIRLLATTSTGDVVTGLYSSTVATALGWQSLGAANATGPASAGLSQSGEVRVAVRHGDDTIWSANLSSAGSVVGGWQQVNTTYGSAPVTGLAWSPHVIYDPQTQLTGILFGTSTSRYRVWETASNSGSFTGSVAARSDTTGVGTDFAVWDFRDEYATTGRRWGYVWTDNSGGKKFGDAF